MPPKPQTRSPEPDAFPRKPMADASPRKPMAAPSTPDRRPQLLGCLAVFASTFVLYLSTLVIRWSRDTVAIDPSFFVFARFLLGFMVVCVTVRVTGAKIRVNRHSVIVGRAITNCVAVFCFYKAISVTTVAEGNILNMTYPLFVTLFSWCFLKGERDLKAVATVLTAFAGVWLVLAPGAIGFGVDNLWGVASGIFAAAAIIYLNMARRDHDTNTILLYLFGLGSLGIWLIFRRHLFIPGPRELLYLLLCGGFGVIGQYLLTVGFRYVTAVEGSILSSTRILLAAVLGPWLAADPPLSLSGWLGALLIFGANVSLALRKARG